MTGQSRRSSSHRTVRSRSRDVIRIVVAVPDQLDRQALEALLATQRGFEVVAEAGTALGAACRCLEQPHDVLVLDLALTTSARESSIGIVLEHSPHTRILALAPHNEENCWLLNGKHHPEPRLEADTSVYPPCLKVALAQGALGAVLRTAPAEELFAAVRCVASGEPWVGSCALQALVSPDGVGIVIPLSPRERQIAFLVSDGRTNKQIAEVLGITEATVKKHIGHIFDKIAVEDRLQLGLYVVRQSHMFV